MDVAFANAQNLREITDLKSGNKAINLDKVYLFEVYILNERRLFLWPFDRSRKLKLDYFSKLANFPKKVGWAAIRKIARRKLDMLEYAQDVQDLKSPPSNRLELLKGNLKEYYSIRINDQWRIIFKWVNGPLEVDIIDYH